MKRSEFNFLPKKSIARKRHAPVIMSIVFIAILFAGYITLQSSDVLFGPTLLVDSPDNGQVIQGPVFVRGATKPDSYVSVNGYGVQSDEEGVFEQKLLLDKGFHEITVTVKNRFGREARVYRQVVVQ